MSNKNGFGYYFLSDNAFALQGTKRAGCDFNADFLAVNRKCFLLNVGIPSFFSAALRKADIVAKLLAFTGDFTLFHILFPKNSLNYIILFFLLSVKMKEGDAAVLQHKRRLVSLRDVCSIRFLQW